MTTAAPPTTEVTIADRIRAVVMSPVALSGIVEIETGAGVLPLDLWDHQIRALRLARLYDDLVILKARQLGMTEDFMLLLLWECIAYPSGDDLVVSLNEREAIFNLSKAKAMYYSTPDWFKEAFPVSKDNAEEFRIRHGQRSAGIVSLPSSENAGRGRNFRRVLADEYARWDNADERIASIIPTVADSGSLIRSSTAKGYNSHHTAFAGAVDEGVDPALGNGAVRMFVGATARPGRDVAWVMKKRAGMEGKLGMQEYPLTPEEAWISSGGCVFDGDALTDLETHSCRPPQKRLMVVHRLSWPPDFTHPRPPAPAAIPDSSGHWRVWADPDPSRRYLISADPCGGGGGQDYAAAVVLDADSYDEVASLHARLEPEQLARELVVAGMHYRGRDGVALLVPEANNTGAAVIALLIEWRYPRIYQTEHFNQRTQQRTTQVGWLTTAKTRPVAIAALQTAVRTGEAGVRNQSAVAEMRRFEDPGNGRPEAADGAHDDQVLAWAIGMAVLERTNAAKPAARTPQDPYVPRVSARTGY